MGLNGNIPIFADVQLSLEFKETLWLLISAKTESVNYSL